MAVEDIIPFPSPARRDGEAVLFPACLYGDSAETRNAWKRIARHAWKHDAWEGALADVPMVPADDESPIIVRSYGDWRTRDRLWHFNWILEAHVPSLRAVLDQPAKQLRLVLDGMSRFWYTVGMLDVNFADTAFGGRFAGTLPSEQECAAVYIPMLRWYVYWLPELLVLAPRFATGWRLCEPTGLDRCQFLRTPLILAYWCRYIDRRGSEMLEGVARNRVIDALLSRGIIEPADGRFRLKE